MSTILFFLMLGVAILAAFIVKLIAAAICCCIVFIGLCVSVRVVLALFNLHPVSTRGR